MDPPTIQIEEQSGVGNLEPGQSSLPRVDSIDAIDLFDGSAFELEDYGFKEIKRTPTQGHYADVCHAEWLPRGAQAPIQVAIKTLRFTSLGADQGKNVEEQIKRVEKRMMREVMACVRHERILHVYGFIRGDRPRIVSRWHENGSLGRYIKDHPNANHVALLKEVSEGLEHLHSRIPAIIHADIKSDNVLVDDNGHAVLCDFGISRVMQDFSSGTTTSGAGQHTRGFAAPELLLGTSKPTKETDAYAFGSLLVEVLSGSRPHHLIRSQYKVMDLVLTNKLPQRKDHPNFPEGLDSLWLLSERCWSMSPERRPSMTEIRFQLQQASGGT